MIGFLAGKVAGKLENQVILKTSIGLGYIVTVHPDLHLMQNDNIDLWILHVKREDKEELYGFSSLQDREWVEKLLKVNGVGPKSAANIVYTLGWQEVQKAIINEDHKTLGSVKGLGAKTAKKIVLELKGAQTDISNMSDIDSKDPTISDFTNALTNMGYRKHDVVATISEMKKDGKWDENKLVDMIKLGLKYLNGGK